jgi:phosphoglycolate phosphatase-like HAD superfamily hydrolase
MALRSAPKPFTAALLALPLLAETGEVFVLAQGKEGKVRSLFRDVGMLPFIDAIDGEDKGPRAACLASRLAGRRTGGRALVIGDTISDMELARSCGLPFHPIMPGAEDKSWEGLSANYLDVPIGMGPAFVSNGLSDFLSSLSAEVPWE